MKPFNQRLPVILLPRQPSGWAIRLWFVILLAVSTGVRADEELQRVKEYQVKALFLYNFANFVEWPDEAFPHADSPLKMCLYGAVPFGSFSM